MSDFDIELDDIANELARDSEHYRADVAGLYFQGKPLYAEDIHTGKERAARTLFTANLGHLRERAEAAKKSAEDIHAAIVADPLSWLDDNELNRAYHLAPFVAEDVARGGVSYLAELDARVNFGRQKLDRASAWLHHRAAITHNVDAPSIQRAAWPAPAIDAEAAAHRARRLLDDIRTADPLYELRQLQRTGFNNVVPV